MTCIFSSAVNLWSSAHFGPLPLNLPSKQCLINAVKVLAENYFSQKKESRTASPQPLLEYDIIVLIFEYHISLSDIYKHKNMFIREEGISSVTTKINVKQLFYFIGLERILLQPFGITLSDPKRISFRTALLTLNPLDKSSLDPALMIRRNPRRIKDASESFFGDKVEGNLLIKAASSIPKQGCEEETESLRKDVSPIFLSEDIGFHWEQTK